MKSMLRFFMLAVAMALMFASCSPERKLEKMIEKHPTLFEQQTVDVIVKETITETDTIYIPKSEGSQTFTTIPSKGDELFLDNENFTTTVEIIPTRNEAGLLLNEVKVHTVVKEKTLFVKDTLYIHKIVKGEAIVPKPIIIHRIPTWLKWGIGIFVAMVLLGILLSFTGVMDFLQDAFSRK